MNAVNIHYKSIKLPNDETIAYQEREGGEINVLLIHGNMTSSKHWDLVLEKMDPMFKLFAVDMRGFGASSYHRKISSIKDFSDDIKAFVDLIGLKNFSIIGWSTGGAVGMQFAADYPGCCEKLVLLASASTRGYPFTDLEGKRLTSYEDVKADPGKTIPIQHAYDTNDYAFLKAVWDSLIYTKNMPGEEKYNEYTADMVTQKNLAEVYHALNTFNISDQHNGLISGNGLVRNLKLPVLVLRGDRDLVVTKQMTEEILADIGRPVRFAELKDCGHSPLIDDLAGLLKHISEFLYQ
ncbi:intracellular short-chain-length polyhydroxyalkanoate depolymerase [Bacillus benzoevorans]|uniref:Pimeloyl-ACP methyl ester carboxylesterase n=1 Tax=Bacillus benzoevorans TaxID=1456 RepID=A0A7X0HVK7_9BACI|nr:alpha/beta hydrolase [Bacillus benzoevorans]MBB6446391.1 pimeloyl-ACP methyl ester carboxylesterase [Bacillus benzoevorans]